MAKTRTGSKNSFFNKKHTRATKEKIRECSKKQFKDGMPEETKEKIRIKNRDNLRALSLTNKLTKEQLEYRNKCVKLAISGNKNHNWKGGISTIYESIRKTDKYKKWRNSIFKRDNYECKICGCRQSGFINAHHIIHFSEILDNNNIKTLEDAYLCNLLWEINNGITVCIKCHIKIHKGEE